MEPGYEPAGRWRPAGHLAALSPALACGTIAVLKSRERRAGLTGLGRTEAS